MPQVSLLDPWLNKFIEYWEIHPSLLHLVFVIVTDMEPRRGSNRIITCPTSCPLLYFDRYCRLDFSSHDVHEVVERKPIDEPVRALLRAHSEADTC